MSCSKPLPPFAFDLLCYLNRDQLERFSIVCRPLKNLIDRYFHSKPFRIFNRLYIRGGSYVLFHNHVPWHPNRDDYSAQQFLDRQTCSIDMPWNGLTYYSFSEMHPYLGPSVRIKWISISVGGSITYNPEQVAEMESLTYLWRDGYIFSALATSDFISRIGAENIQLVLNSPTILQCQTLEMINAHFSFKDYKVLYAVKVIRISHYAAGEIDLWQQYWQQFLEQPGVKPIVLFSFLRRNIMVNLIDCLSKVFSTAVSPNAFKIVFVRHGEPLTTFRETNYNSREILELKKGLPVENLYAPIDSSYTLERSSI